VVGEKARIFPEDLKKGGGRLVNLGKEPAGMDRDELKHLVREEREHSRRTL